MMTTGGVCHDRCDMQERTHRTDGMSSWHSGERIQGWVRRSLSRLLARRVFELSNTLPLVSFTFDDFPLSALITGGRILKHYGVRGTYYASLGLAGQDSPSGRIFSTEHLARLLADGHELGCHTFTHCHAWETRPSTFEESVVRNREAAREVVPGCCLETLSYPIGSPRPGTKQRAGRYFACCRGGGQIFNGGAVDLNHLAGFFLEQSRDNPGLIQTLIDRNREERGWLIFATHDICENPSRFGCTPAFFEKIVSYAAGSGAKVLPVFRAWEAIRADKQ